MSAVLAFDDAEKLNDHLAKMTATNQDYTRARELASIFASEETARATRDCIIEAPPNLHPAAEWPRTQMQKWTQVYFTILAQAKTDLATP
jgi:hypothetical protein